MSNDQWILIIDDEEDLARLMETVLHKEGIPNIITAGTIADGWAKFQKFGSITSLAGYHAARW